MSITKLTAIKTMLHGLSRGIIAHIQGGSFRAGFFSGLSSALDVGTKGYGDFVARTMIMAVVGGTAAVIGGGKFANGALSAAFVHMFNAENLSMKILTSSPFLFKYFFGFGTDMQIDPNSHLGLRLRVALRSQMNTFRNYAKAGLSGIFSLKYNLTNTPLLFPLGDGKIFADIGQDGDYYYVQFFIRDKFIDALDINDAWDGNQDIGIPYNINFDYLEIGKR